MPKVDLKTLNDPNQNVELREPPLTGLWVTLGSAIFVITGGLILMDANAEDVLPAWLATGFFGICLIVGLMKLFGPKDTLELDKTGFTFSSLGRKTRMEWYLIDRFGIIGSNLSFGRPKLVGMNMAPAHRSNATDIARTMTGFDGGLPSNYGVKTAVLAAAMQVRLDACRSQ